MLELMVGSLALDPNPSLELKCASERSLELECARDTEGDRALSDVLELVVGLTCMAGRDDDDEDLLWSVCGDEGGGVMGEESSPPLRGGLGVRVFALMHMVHLDAFGQFS